MKTIWLIGASEGIGAELAKVLSKNYALVISARQVDKLTTLLARLENPERHTLLTMDVTNEGSVKQVCMHPSTQHIDMLIYNAGYYEPCKSSQFNYDLVEKTLAVNLLGACRVLEKLIPQWIERKEGHIALVGSVAGYRGLPNALGYGLSKAALIHLAENLKADLTPYGVKVQVINPGFVKTRLTDKNNFYMPSLITPQQASEYIAKGLKSKRFEIHFPKRFSWVMKTLRILPYKLYFSMIKRLNG